MPSRRAQSNEASPRVTPGTVRYCAVTNSATDFPGVKSPFRIDGLSTLRLVSLPAQAQADREFNAVMRIAQLGYAWERRAAGRTTDRAPSGGDIWTVGVDGVSFQPNYETPP